MIQGSSPAKFTVYGELNRVPNLNTAFFYSTPMDRKLWRWMLGIGDFHNITAGRPNSSPVAHLTAGFTIKRRRGGNNIYFFAFNCLGLAVTVTVDSQDIGFAVQPVVADKRDWTVQLDLCIHAGSFSRIAATSALFFHKFLEAGLIDGHLVGVQNVFGQVQRKAVSVVKAKSDIARKDSLFILFELRGGFLEQDEAFFQG